MHDARHTTPGARRMRLHDFYQRHRLFLLILLLFAGFRLLAVLLFRPGGYIADYSDHGTYAAVGALIPQGYRAYENLWLPYPPLFPALSDWLYLLAARVPPWEDARFFFSTLLALAILVFDTGNLVLIYRLAGTLAGGESQAGGDAPPAAFCPPTLLPPLLYALFFAPVYTLLGWFEPMPLFFLLLGLDLLLSGRTRPWGWAGSAVAAGLGFLTKLTPALLAPVAVRWLGARLSLAAARRAWFRRRSPGNLLRPALYVLICAGTVAIVGYPLVRANPGLAFSSLRAQSIRPPWQSLWALLDGYFGFGLVPLDQRNLAGLGAPLWESRLPWPWITLGFVLLYLWLYTRHYDWDDPRTPVAFTAVSVLWLFLYSKGWSPQFVVWVLAFIALLLPTLRGVVVATVLTVVNFVESTVYLILLPGETWILWGTVLVRTALLILLALDFAGQIWPGGRGARLRRVSGVLSWATVAVALLAATAAAPRAARAYAAQRLAAHPCREAIATLQAAAVWPADLLVLDRSETWAQFYPWLRHEYELHVVDGYSPGRDPAQVWAERLAARVEGEAEFWWLAWAGGAGDRGGGAAPAQRIFDVPGLQILESQQLGQCTLSRGVPVPEAPLAVAGVAGGPIHLLRAAFDAPAVGEPLHLVLYWRAQTPVADRYTVFTQLFDPSGQLAAQQDNWPVGGLAPTDSWQPGIVVRDAYRLAIAADAEPGAYRLLVGLYTAAGRQPLTLPDGRVQDFVEFTVQVTPP